MRNWLNFSSTSGRAALLTVVILNQLGLALLYFADSTESELSNYFNADCLLLPSLYRDVILNGNALGAWCISTAPFLVPDMVLVFLLNFLTGNFVLASYLFSFVQLIALVWLSWQLFKRLSENGVNYALVTLSLLLGGFFLLKFQTEYFYHAFYLLSVNHHFGTFVLALLSMVLLLKSTEASGKRIYLLILLYSFSVFSDKLYLVYFAFPTLLALLFLSLTGRLPNARRILVLQSAILIVSFLIAEAAYLLVRKLGVVNFPDLGPTVDPLIFMKKFEALYSSGFEGIKTYFGDLFRDSFLRSFYWVLAIGVWMADLCCVFLPRFRERFSEKQLLFLCFGCFALPLVFLAPVTRWHVATPYEWERYYFPAFVFACINASFLLAEFIPSPERLATRVIFPALLLLQLGFIGKYIISENALSGFVALTRFYPAKVQELDNIITSEGFQAGVCEYWDAKFYNMFTRTSCRMYAVYNDLNVYPVLASLTWYYNPQTGHSPAFTFVCNRNGYFNAIMEKERAGTEIPLSEGTLVPVKPFTFTAGYQRRLLTAQP